MRSRPAEHSRINKYVASVGRRAGRMGLGIALALAIAAPAHAQGVAQATVTGFPGILPTPTITGQLQRYHEGQYSLQFVYSSPNAQPVQFRFHVLLEREGQVLLDVTSLPTAFQPGMYRWMTFADAPAIRFQQTTANVLADLNAKLGGQVKQAGVLPEGLYTLTIEPIVVDKSLLISPVPGMAGFTVNYAEQPVLVTPTDNASINPNLPLFNWTPVVGLASGNSVDYELHIVEVWQNQSPQRAIEANPDQLRITLTGQTVYTYTKDQLPLQAGKRYAWQVTAHEQVNQLPILNDGKTEVFTFRVSGNQADQGTQERFSWSYPAQSPFVAFDVRDALLSLSRISINGRYQGTVAGSTMNATFDNLALSTDGNQILDGRVTFDRSMSFQAQIASGTGSLSGVQALPSGSSLSGASMLAFEPGIVQLSSTGVTALGQGTGAIKYQSIDLPDLTTSYSSDFLLGLSPMRIAQGRVTFSARGIVVGYADGGGFHAAALSTQDLLSLVPEKLPVPSTNVAYLVLRRNGQLLVDVSAGSDGSVVLGTKSGEQIHLVIPALQGQPDIAVTLDNVHLAPGTYRISSGRVTATVSDDNTKSLLTSRKIPVSLSSIEYSPSNGLLFTGALSLFGNALSGGGMVSLRLNESGSIQGNVSLTNLDQTIPLVQGSDKAVLHLRTVNGRIDIPLLSGFTPAFELGLGADFILKEGDKTAASLSMTATVNSDGAFTITKTDTGAFQNPPALNLGNLSFALSQLRALTLSYHPSTGFDFNASVDVRLAVKTDSSDFRVPLSNIEIRKTGFFIPEQSVNESTPGFSVPAFDLGPVNLRLLAFRMPAITLDWFHWTAGAPNGLSPKFDFEVHFPGFKDKSGQLSDAPVTLQNVGLDGRFLTGTLVPYDFSNGGVLVPFNTAGTVGLRIKHIEGSLSRVSDAQSFDIRMGGGLYAPSMFPADSCPPPNFTVHLASRSGFDGRIDGIQFCPTVQAGPLALHFSDGYLQFSSSSGTQQIRVGGQVTAKLNSPNFSQATATGSIDLDLVSGSVVQSSIVFRNITWSYPKANPFFTFTVGEADVTQSGITLNGGGTLSLGQGKGNVNVNFTGLGVGFDNGEVTAGTVQITGGFGIEIGINPLKWSISGKTSLAQQDSNRVLLVLHPGLKLTKDGMTINDSSSASVNALGKFEASMTVAFNDFVLGFSPIGARSGRADFNTKGGRIGYIDNTGFHIDNPLAVLPIPERLNLGTAAHIVLKDSAGNYLVDLGNQTADGTGRSLKTKDGLKTKLVLDGIGTAGKHPEIDLAFSVTINTTTYEVMSGSISADLSSSPLNLMDYGFPFELTLVEFAKNGNAFKLTAGARVSLPAKLAGLNQPLTSVLTFSDQGFESAQIDVGTYAQQRPQNASSTQPLKAIWMADSSVGINVRGIHVVIGTGSPSFGVCGDLDSKLFGMADGHRAQLFYVSQFDISQKKWTFALNANHLTGGKIPVSKAIFTQDPNSPLTLTVSPEVFAVSLAGTVAIPDIGSDFAITLKKFYLGSDKVDVQADATVNQSFNLFGDFITLKVSRIGVDYTSTTNVLYADMDGSIDTKIAKQKRGGTDATANSPDLIAFTGLRVGTDGSFALGSGQLNLLSGHSPIQVLPNIFWLNSLSVGYKDQAFTMGMTGTVVLPMPGKSQTDTANAVRSAVSFAINSRGEVTQPLALTFAFDTNSPPLEGNNPATELKLGDIVTFELTGAALDFDVMNPANTSLYATAAVHLHPKGTSAGLNTDAKGKPRVFTMGNATNIRTEYGLKYNFTSGLQYRLDIQASDANPLFEFTAGMFTVAISSINLPDVNKFEVTIGGKASLDLKGVTGSFGFAGFTVGSSGVTDWGHPDGAMSLGLMDVVSLELGAFEYHSQTANGPALSVVRQKKGVDANGKETETDLPAVSVREYLKFSNIRITMGKSGSFSGGVKQVLYYRDTNGGTGFFVDDAEFEMGSSASLHANLEFVSDNTGFLLRVTGIGNVSQIGFLATGKIANKNNQLSFGIFLAVTGIEIDLLPIAPRTIVLTGAGGGFFYHPETEDLQIVITALGQLTGGQFKANNPNGLPQSSNLTFAILLYAQVGLVGGSGTFAVEGNALLIITDQFASVDINGVVLNQTGKLSAGAYLTFIYPKSDGSFTIQGGIRVDVVYDPVATGKMTVDFFISRSAGSSTVLWAAWGNADVTILKFITMHGDFLVSSNGMLVNLKYDAHFDITIITIDGNISLSFWYYTPTKSLGVYAELSISADVLGGLASVSATLKGALIITGNDYLVYAAASAHLKVIGVFDGSISLWISIHNGDLDGGEGSNDYYEQMIQDSRNQVAGLKQQAQQLQTAINQAKADQYKFSFEDLAKAGMRLRTLPPAQRRAYANQIIADEKNSGWPSGVPAILQTMADSLFAAPSQPTDADAQASYQVMQKALADMQSKADAVEKRIGQLQVQIAANRKAQQAAVDMRSPLQSTPGQYSFTVDTQLDAQQSGQLASLKLSNEALDAYYQNAIKTGADNLAQVNALMTGNNGVNEFLPTFYTVYEKVGEYYAKEVDYHFGNVRWGSGAINFAQNSYTALSAVVPKVEGTGNVLSGAAMTIIRTKSLAAARYANVLLLSSATDSLLTKTDMYTKSSADYLTYLGTISTVKGLQNELEAKGYNLWYDVPVFGASAYMQWHMNQVEGLRKEFTDIVWNTLRTRYQSLSTGVSGLYATKSQMIETQVSLIDAYVAWKGKKLAASAATDLKNQRQALALSLEPPRLTSLTATPTLMGFYNKLRMDWTATHPSGPVVESIVRLMSGYEDFIVTVGDRTSITTYPFSEFYGEGHRNLILQLAVRSPGGTLFFATAKTLDVCVSPNVIGTTTYLTNRPVNALPDSASKPPAAPTVQTPYGTGPNGIWVSDPTTVALVASTYDPAGDRVTFEYAVGSGANDTSIRGWTAALSGKASQAVIDRYKETLWQEVTGRQVDISNGENTLPIVIDGLSLQTGTAYSVSVRATNGFNQTSAATKFTVKYDATGPVFGSSTGSAVIIPMDIGPDGVRGGTAAAQTRPQVIMDFAKLDQLIRTQYLKKPANVRLTWPAASDQESALLRYEYIVTDQSDPQAVFAAASGTSAGTDHIVTAQDTFFSSTHYAHIRATNYAGGTSLFTIGPIAPTADQSRPVAPQTRIGYQGDRLVLWMTLPSYDQETGIKGYQYAIGALPNGWDSGPPGDMNIRPWPQGSMLDFPAGVYDIPADGDLAPGYYLNATGVESPNPIYVYLRAANGQGMFSTMTPSGGAGFNVHDITPPLYSKLDFEYHRAQTYPNTLPEALFVYVHNVCDPGSGVASVRFRLVDAKTNEQLDTLTVSIDPKYTKTPTLFTDGPLRFTDGRMYRGRLIHVVATITNGAGLQTTIQGDLDLLPRPPGTPTVTGRVLTYGYTQPLLRLQVGNIVDAENGVQSVEFKVEDAQTNDVLKDWSDGGVAFSGGLWYGSATSSEVSDFSDSYKGRLLRVSVRVNNGIGVSATTTITTR